MNPNILLSAPIPTDIFHDQNALALIGIVVAIVGVAVGVITFIKRLPRKEIAYQVSTDSPIISVDLGDRIKVKFDGQPVEYISLVIIKVWNSGDVSIKTSDYVHPIVFAFEGRKILDVTIPSMEPRSLVEPGDLKKFLEENKPLPPNEKETIELPKFHINSRKRTGSQNMLILKVLLSGSKGDIKVEGMIDDGKITKSNPDTQQNNRFPFQIIAGSTAIAFVAAGDLLILNSNIIGLTLVITGILLGVAVVSIPLIKRFQQYL